jgi:hypothetical protein
MQDLKDVMLLKEEEGQETKVKSGAFENPCNSNLATPVTRVEFSHLRLTTASNQLIKLLGIT